MKSKFGQKSNLDLDRVIYPFRKIVEKEMARTNGVLSLCVATNSLEIGIDIGDIDAVVLIEPPHTISSFMQRIGRGNRRTNNTICFGVYSHYEDKEIFDEMINNARNEILEELLARKKALSKINAKLSETNANIKSAIMTSLTFESSHH